MGIIPKDLSETCIVTLPKLQVSILNYIIVLKYLAVKIFKVDPVFEMPELSKNIVEKESSINIEDSDNDADLKDVVTGSELFNTESESNVEIPAPEVIEYKLLEIEEEAPKPPPQEKKLLSIDLSHHEEEILEEQEEALEEQEIEI